MSQKFFFYFNNEKLRLDDNINNLPKEQIENLMNSLIYNLNLDKNGKYIAIGTYGNHIIYNNGNIYKM
jgi:hypothetical protein